MLAPKTLGLAVVGIALHTGCAAPAPLTDEGAAAYEASLAATTDGFVVAWHDSRTRPSTLAARRLDRAGAPVGRVLALTDGPDPAWEADVEALGEGFVVAWYETPRGGPARALIASFDDQGGRRWVRTVSEPERDGRNPVALALNNDQIFVAWQERDADGARIRAQLLSSDGSELTTPLHISEAGLTTWNLNVDADLETAWLVWDSSLGSDADEIFVARIRTAGTNLEVLGVDRMTSDDGSASKYPDVALGGGSFALAWYDRRDGNDEVYFQTGHTSDAPARLEATPRRVTTTQGSSIGAYVAWNGAAFGLAWSDQTDSNYDVYFRAFSTDGRPLADAQRLTTNPTESLIPAIEPTADGFGLAWNEDVEEERTSHLVGGRSEVVFSIVAAP